MQRTAARGGEVTATISGELDHCTAAAIRAQLDALIADPSVTTLTLDLENLTFMDSSGVGVLLGRLRILQARGGTLGVRNLRPPIEKLFRLTGMHRVITIEGGRQA